MAFCLFDEKFSLTSRLLHSSMFLGFHFPSHQTNHNNIKMLKVPQDLITNTFYQLPVKTLLRFRCLSKPLCSLIDDPDFIKLHLSHSISTKSHLRLILKGLHLYSVDLDSLDKATPFNYYPESIWTGTEVFGSCNGLLALSNSDVDLALFNPATRKLFKLPVDYIDLPEKSCIRGFVFYGFGHDFMNDDYKVVRMVQFKKDEDDNLGCFIEYEVKVFSFKTNSWRRVKELPNYLQFLFQFYYHLMHRRGYGVYANGVIHWVMPRRPEFGIGNLIVAFDLGVEEFRILPQPDYGDSSKDFVLDVGVLEGLLCLMCNYDLVKVDVWMMKEYGVKESWTKMFSIDRSTNISNLRFLRPLFYSNGDDGEKILLEVNDEKLVWYNFRRKRMKTVRIKGGPDSFVAIICVESLVHLDKGGVGKNKPWDQEEKKKENRKNRDDFLSKGFKLVL